MFEALLKYARALFASAKRRAWILLKRQATSLVRWSRRHKAQTVVFLLVAYMFFSQISVDHRIADLLQERQSTAAVAPKPRYGVGGFIIDDEPGLPANLDTKQIRQLVVAADHLKNSFRKLDALNKENDDLSQAIASDYVFLGLWTRLRLRAFKDKALPEDWYVALFLPLSMQTNLINMDMYYLSMGHTKDVQIRILGAKPTQSDVQFLKVTQKWMDMAIREQTQRNVLLRDVDARTKAEFAPPPNLDGSQPAPQ